MTHSQWVWLFEDSVAASPHTLETQSARHLDEAPRALAHCMLRLHKQLGVNLIISTPCLRFNHAWRRNFIPALGVFSSSRLLVFSYCTALIMSKIGRYIATTIPPTTTPRNTIITGSRSANNPLTAASTSSS